LPKLKSVGGGLVLEPLRMNELSLRLGIQITSASEPLPASYNTRWVAARKAQVVEAVRDGRITLADALDRYRLSLAEFQSWEHTLTHEGIGGLRCGHRSVPELAQHDAGSVKRVRRKTDAD
jgi:hypothetical protein